MKPIVAELGTWFWRLLPANPIVVRVVHVGSRRLPHLWARLAYLSALLLVLLAALLSAMGGGAGDAGGSLSELAKTLTRVFVAISVLQLAMMCLLAPVFTAGAISQEKDAETFNVLLTTPLSNAQIVLGSLLSRLFFVLALLLSGLPIFCITMLFGGVTGEQIFLSFGIAACTAVLTGALAIMISVMRVGTRGTIFSFYMGIAIFVLAGLGLGYLKVTHVPESIPPGGVAGMSFLAPFHPFLALDVALGRTIAPDFEVVAHYAWPLNRMLASPSTAYMAVTLIVSVLFVAVATLFVRRGIKQGEMSPWTRLTRRFFRGSKEGEERTRRARRVWSNPVAWREAVTRASAASSNLVRYSYLAAGIAAAAAFTFAHLTGQFASVGEARQWLTGIVIIEFVIVLLMAANTAATAITREREAGTMELLLSTPLTSKYIVYGKLRGLISFTIPLLALPAATVMGIALIDFFRGAVEPVVYLSSAFYLPPLLLAYSAFACLVGLHMSLKNRTSVQAVLASVGLLLAIGFGLGFCGWGLIKSSGPVAALLTPLAFVVGVFLVLNPDVAVDPSWGGSVAAIEFTLLFGTLVAVGLYSAIVAGTYKSMVTNFDMIVRKQAK